MQNNSKRWKVYGWDFFYSSILWFLFCSNIRFERARIKFTFSIEKNNKITENLSDRLKRKHFYVATVPFHTHILFSPKKKTKMKRKHLSVSFLEILAHWKTYEMKVEILFMRLESLLLYTVASDCTNYRITRY